ncbi:TPA: hypothetical protein ACXGBW_002673 [Escherichia coli]
MIDDGVYSHTLFGIAYMLKGDKVLIMTIDDPYWKDSLMSREQMQLLLDAGLLIRKL